MSNPTPFIPVREPLEVLPQRSLRLVKTENKLRVLHVGKFYPPHPGGMESHLEALCNELKGSLDLKVLVASSNGHRTSQEVQDGVEVVRLSRLFSLRSAPVCPQMVREIRAAKADVVHIHLPNPTAILAYLASGHRGRLVITYHSDIVRQKVLRRFFDPILRYALDRADAIIASSWNYIRSSEVLSAYEEKSRVIPFGIPVAHFQQRNALEVVRIRRLYGPRIVLSVGRLVYYKGFEHLISAMKQIEGHLLIVGNGPLQGELQQHANRSGVSGRVTFLTDVKDVRPYYHAADVFALPSVARSEAFGIVQLEAMACGKPVVNTNLDTGVPSVSIDGVSGITVPPADPEKLGGAINSLLNDPLRSEIYGRAGQLRVEQKFNLRAMARETLTLYREVVDLHQSVAIKNLNQYAYSS
jgi:glycosyltransferase involved in cell wall biosynthesis